MKAPAKHSHRWRLRARSAFSLQAVLALLTVASVCLGAFLLSRLASSRHSLSPHARRSWQGVGSEYYLAKPSSGASQCAARLTGSGLLQSEGTKARWDIYDALGQDMAEHGLMIDGTQGVSVGGMFAIDKGILRPRLQQLAVPVRAIIFRYVDEQVQHALQNSVERHILPLASKTGVWMQDPALYHSTVYHASPHQFPVPASGEEIEEEIRALQAAAFELCPPTVELARVVVSSRGVIMAAWQVKSGEDPIAIRAAITAALPRAPPAEKQTIRQPAILHTTLARLTEAPRHADASPESALQVAAERMTTELCGLSSTIRSLWYVQEEDLLALALGGKYTAVEFSMTCHKTPY